MNDFLKIEYWNDCDADIYYGNGFKQFLFLDADLINPDYDLNEEGVEDGDKEFVRTFGKVTKHYNIDLVIPEYLLHALSFMQLHDEVWIVRKTGERAKMIDISIRGNPIFKDCYFRTNIDFYIDFIRTECCEDRQCLEANHADIDGRYDTDSAQWNDPPSVPVANGRRYLFYEPGTAYNGYIYTYDRGLNVWNIESQVNGDVVDFGELSMYFDGIWHEYPTAAQDGNDLRGYAIPGSFVQLQEKNGVWADVEDPVTDGVYTGTGIDISGYIGSEVRVYCYNHSCEYGYSTSVNLV